MNYLLFMGVNTMTMQKIEFEYEIPDGYRFVRFGAPNNGDLYLISAGKVTKALWEYSEDWIIIEKIPEQVQPTQNTKRHKHADLIHAWAEGAIIQFKLPEDAWEDCINNSPAWGVGQDYRIKPAIKTIKFRNWLTKSGRISVWNLIEGGSVEDSAEFKCWIGDWQSVEEEE